jgi:hypothetical protein
MHGAFKRARPTLNAAQYFLRSSERLKSRARQSKSAQKAGEQFNPASRTITTRLDLNFEAVRTALRIESLTEPLALSGSVTEVEVEMEAEVDDLS